MRVGFVMLAHTRLDRAAAVARHLVAAGAPVTVHVDRRVARDVVAGAGFPEAVQVLRTRKADWGRIGLIEASLDAVRDLLHRCPELTHICLVSGADLPLRPLAELDAYLGEDPERDHIESVPVTDDKWVVDGLSEERATLYHPFSFRDAPRLFSMSVEVQRRLGVRRRLPDGLQLHLGMQWWCLSTRTLRALVEHPRLAAWIRFFRRTWIPDESFFQTLVRHLRPEDTPGPGLHLNRFNPQGRPVVFHDDHLSLLEGADHFFARKIDPDADALCRRFLEQSDTLLARSGFEGRVDGQDFEDAHGTAALVRPGLIAAHRLPVGTTQTRAETARPYLVLCSDRSDLLERVREHFGSMEGTAFHGRLFRPGAPASFAGEGMLWRGNIPADAPIRDDRPAQWLANVVRSALPERTIFLLGQGDDPAIRLQLCIDAKARLVLLMEEDAVPGWFDRMRQPAVLPAPAPIRRRKRKRKVPPSPLWSWRRRIDPVALGDDLAGTGGAEALSELEGILSSDLTDPTGWTVPDD